MTLQTPRIDTYEEYYVHANLINFSIVLFQRAYVWHATLQMATS